MTSGVALSLIIFGASTLGAMLIDEYPDYSWSAFTDNNPEKWGTHFMGLPVIPPKTALSAKLATITIASQHFIEIIEQLRESKIDRFYLYSLLPESSGVKGLKGELQEIFIDDALRPIETLLLVSNHSGSNSLALHKSGELTKAGIEYKFHKILKHDQKYINNIFSSKLKIVTHANYDLPKNSKTIQLWHGFPLKGINLTSRNEKNFSRESARRKWLDHEYISSYSQTYSTLMNACFGGVAEQYIVTGMPRNDLLLSSDGAKNLNTITGKNTSSRKLIFYIPTFRTTKFGQKNGKDQLPQLGINDFSEENFLKFLDENKLSLITKPHPYHHSSQDIINSELIVPIEDSDLRENNLDFYEILSAADLLITDYSSVYFDFLLLNKPIIFTAPDLEIYDKNRGFLLSPFEFWTPGEKPQTQEDLQREILEAISSPLKNQEARNTIKRIVHHYEDAGSSERVSSLIAQTLEMKTRTI